MMRNVLCLLVALATISAGAASDRWALFAERPCCGSDFSDSAVLRFAHTLDKEFQAGYVSVLIIPTGSEQNFLVGSTTEEQPAFCLYIASRRKSKQSHAYFFRTPLGASIHSWDPLTSTYRIRLLRGRDVYSQSLLGSRLAWIGPHYSAQFSLRIVAEDSLSNEKAKALTKRWMKELGMSTAVATVRGDPYFWPDGCYPYSLPLQWRDKEIPSLSQIQEVSTRCHIDARRGTESCHPYR